jgi:hypothetical protein
MSARIDRILKSGISRKLPISAFSFEDCVSEDELDPYTVTIESSLPQKDVRTTIDSWKP